MADQGWYPDPAGSPNRYRYWDGQTWSETTSDDPRQPPPSPGGPKREQRSPKILILGAVALVLLLIITGVVVIGRITGTIAGPLPSSTVSGWDDSSPVPSGSPTPPPSPSSSARAPGDDVPCPDGGGGSSEQPPDGRIHGGGLSFPEVPDYDSPGPQYGFRWADDVNGQSKTTEPGWISYLVVGALQRGEGFDTAKEAATSSIQCAITSGWYPDFTGAKVLRNEAITVDGAKGWINSTQITNPKPGLSVDGDVFTAVVLDTGKDDQFAVYYAMIPTGDQPRARLAASTLAALRVD